MYSVRLKVSPSAVANFDYIDFDSLEKAINVVVNQLVPINENKNKTIKVSYTKGCNQYFFGKNAILIGEHDVKYRERVFLKTFLHEFRHWVQDKIYKINYNKNYVDYDVNAAKYYKCPIEKDSRLFTAAITADVYSLYKRIVKLKNKVHQFNKTNPTEFYI